MNLFKILGAIALMTCGMWSAKSANRGVERVFEQYVGFESLISFFRIQIECFGLPCDEIFTRCERDLLRSCGYLYDAVPRNLSELYKGCEISDDELDKLIKGFSSEFGIGYREEELRLCDYYLSLLRDKRKKLLEELKRKKKVNTTLWVSGALGAVILLF